MIVSAGTDKPWSISLLWVPPHLTVDKLKALDFSGFIAQVVTCDYSCVIAAEDQGFVTYKV